MANTNNDRNAFLYNLKRSGYTVWTGQPLTAWQGIKLLLSPDNKTLLVENNAPHHAGYVLAIAENYQQFLTLDHHCGDSEWNIHFEIPSITHGYDVDEILKHYLVAALWSSHGDDESMLDSKYSVDDFLETSIQRTRNDIQWFLYHAFPWLYETGLKEAQIGHDFWLTRCGHGTGFWDRELGFKGEKLTKICASFFGNVDAMECDGGKVELI